MGSLSGVKEVAFCYLEFLVQYSFQLWKCKRFCERRDSVSINKLLITFWESLLCKCTELGKFDCSEGSWWDLQQLLLDLIPTSSKAITLSVLVACMQHRVDNLIVRPRFKIAVTLAYFHTESTDPVKTIFQTF